MSTMWSLKVQIELLGHQWALQALEENEIEDVETFIRLENADIATMFPKIGPQIKMRQARAKLAQQSTPRELTLGAAGESTAGRSQSALNPGASTAGSQSESTSSRMESTRGATEI